MNLRNGFVDSPSPPTPEGARRKLEHGGMFPYDFPDSWREEEGSGYPVNPATSWQVAAARGIVADLMDRRDIKRGFENVDEDVRQEIILTLAAIIEAAPEWYAKQQQETGHEA